ncbi:MAG: hypothetical protein C4B58_06680 [Deltaproteobacteria bacterium]|nr:MAG: hypothetical protein C4B58_06680 [Deltaproteobacteria bacterium]
MEHVFDVIIVGAGPGGSSMAAFLSRSGVSTLLLDKACFPRDKVCGDGLTPKAIYWLDFLGCVNEVLNQSNSYCTQGDIFVNGEHVLTGKFPQNTSYPGFSVFLERRKLDHILVRNAISSGALFRPGSRVKKLQWAHNGILVEVESDNTHVCYKGKLVIGADGANSIVSRAIGNKILNGTTAVSVRGYYKGVDVDRSQIQLYFNERFFPGYGWVFVDNDGKANIGIGYAFDKNFPVKKKLRKVFHDFVSRDLKKILKHAEAIGIPKAGWTSFYKPRSMVASRVMLIGDAANLADPVNGGGIHSAIESAHLAAQVAMQAIAFGDFSSGFLCRYESLWNERTEMDWRTGELLLSIAKNPNLREVYISLIKAVAKMIKENPRFEQFLGGIFSGVMPARKCICPFSLLDVTPLDPRIWLSALVSSPNPKPLALLEQAVSAMQNTLKTTVRIVSNPMVNLYWGLEILSKTLGLVGCYANHEMVSSVNVITRGWTRSLETTKAL